MTAIRSLAGAVPARAPHKPAPPDLVVVRGRRVRRSMLTRLGMLLLFALFAAVFGVVVFQTLRVQNQNRLDDLHRRIGVEQDRAKELRLQLADAKAPERIATAARTRLGMVPPNDVAYLQPKPDDDAKAAWDPQTEPLPAPPTTAPPVTTPPISAPAPAASPKTTTAAPKPTTTPTTTKPATTPTTAKPASTPTTTKPATTATTAKPATTPTTVKTR
jgi:cell division protein FtsL